MCCSIEAFAGAVNLSVFIDIDRDLRAGRTEQ